MPNHPFLKSIRPVNLLSFGPNTQEIELRPLNILIGPNGSGKSNFIEIIGLLTTIKYQPYVKQRASLSRGSSRQGACSMTRKATCQEMMEHLGRLGCPDLPKDHPVFSEGPSITFSSNTRGPQPAPQGSARSHRARPGISTAFYIFPRTPGFPSLRRNSASRTARPPIPLPNPRKHPENHPIPQSGTKTPEIPL